jgi:hypothetical protein
MRDAEISIPFLFHSKQSEKNEQKQSDIIKEQRNS